MSFGFSLFAAVFSSVGLVLGIGLGSVRLLGSASAQRAVVTPFAGVLGLHGLATVFHLAGVPAGVWPWLVTPLAAWGWWQGREEIAAWRKQTETRETFLLWAGVVTVGLLWLSMIRNYSGGDWIGDWAGHFHRAQYFLHPEQDWSWMLARDPLAGRPPLQNLVTALLLSVAGESMARYQVISLLLGSLVVLPMSWWLTRLAGDGAPKARRWLGAFLVCNPMVMQNLTYPWTKLLTAAWVVMAVALAWQAIKTQRDPVHSSLLAAGAMAAALITHYSAAIFVVVLGPVFVVQLWHRHTTTVFRRATGARSSLA